MNDHNAALNTRYKAIVSGNRDLTMMVQSTNIGSLSNTPAMMAVRNGQIPIGGDTIEFGPLAIQFFVQEDMHEWIELYRWLIDTTNWDDDKSDVLQIEIFSANHKPLVRFKYHDAIPVELDDAQLTHVDGEEYITSTASFEYSTIEVEILATGETIAYGV